MPLIKPFRGWRYNAAVVKDPARVLAPPYDVISPAEQDALHQKSPHNVVRLILGREEAGDSPANSRYTRARDFFRSWKSSGILSKDAVPSIYIYRQDYGSASRIGFLAAMKIDEGAVLKHENTLAAPKADRMALIREVRANLSPIFGLFEDKKGAIQKILKKSMAVKPAVDVRMDGVRHRLFVESHPAPASAISAAMESKPLYIADGHHRFEVACQFQRWMREHFPGDETSSWNYVMTYFSDFAHNPFTIFPTHRLIKISKTIKNPMGVLAKVGARHAVPLQKVSGLNALLKQLEKPRASSDKKYRFGVYHKKSGFFILTLNARTDRSPVERLDVAVLHSQIIAPCFKIRRIEKSGDIDFTRDAKEAVAKVNSGAFDLAFFLRPASLKEMVDISKRGLKMPQKSTYFWPKLLSGLVFHGFED